MTIEHLTYTNEDNQTMVLLVDDQMFGKYHNDEGVTASQVVDSYDVFKYETGRQGTLFRPSKTELETAFGTNNADKVVEFMLDNGKLRVRSQRHGNKKEHKNNTHSRLHVEHSGRPL
mmetsp:Transcript_44863/g.65932  ORF Transcript_44863/g.65932 Transcript_44863/m.65932 type:complete len:117 (+) Transcript_44863:72-422(+)|eukprot:CAMPEP_0195518510 /NCGR_PEP_ID=MMETSP0794_2-20130614/13037_1 /TAXON_ID=515487 /ORGANISM="Stephanopyxis turris, Strain CCMP 815" /LENGTH=116 /DNA_ID=CAMNT_0040647487 /DNA_START=72 /DNA_END=422 /DNA_ORIENTATION=-